MPVKTQKHVILFRLVVLLALLLPGGLATTAMVGQPAVLAAPEMTNTITLRVVSMTGEELPEYKFLINIDNTGDPLNEEGCNPFLADGVTRNPDYPDNCDLPGIRLVPGWSPIFTQGEKGAADAAPSLTLPDGKYLVSITADGYKLDGEHFTIPLEAPGVVDVAMHPFPLPPASMVIQVFDDSSLTNGQFDAGVENGLAGFRASLNDIAGEITTDIFGNPLCTTYIDDPDTGEKVVDQLGTGCYSDVNGIINIPNIGPLRYDVLIFPPAGEPWIQTTTLEGSHGWDTWLQEAGTGLDNEFLIAAEPAPWTLFGFVNANTTPPADWVGTGSITGVIMGAATWVPAQGGLPYVGDTFAGFSGTKLHRAIVNPWLSLNDLQRGDEAVWVGQGNADGSFLITGVPDGNYFLTYWDENQHYILDFVQVNVSNGQMTDVGIRMLTGWFTEMYGTVFHDYNENGKQDPGEPGIPNYLVVLKDRDNTEIDRMSIASATNTQGVYELEKGYPMGSWMILEAYSDLYRTTGITYQTLNMTEEVTLLGGIVDIGVLPILGQPVRVDWGVKPYTRYENGGIAGTVFYDTVRAEDEARYAGVEPWQPGIPGLTMQLYQAQVDAYGQPVLAPDGSYAKGQLLMETETETYARPKGCQALDVDGNPVDFPVLPEAAAGKDCLEGPLMGTQIGDGQNDLDGNWGFSEGCLGTFIDPVSGLEVPNYYDPMTQACASGTAPAPLPAGNYLVEVVIPNDASGNPMFIATREEDLNIFDGDVFIPNVPPPACAGPLHTVDVLDSGTDFYSETVFVSGGITVTVPASTPVENPGYAEIGSRYEGQAMPLCNVKFVNLSNGKAVAPVFNLFTEVPIPGKWKGYIIDNLNVSVDPNTLFFGEMAGVPNVPIGLYDFSGRLVHTVHSDRDGVYEALMPSTGTFNAPSPSGMFANVYYQYGNDPGPTSAPNVHYNPQYRSIGTSFEVYPGTILPADLAPTQNGSAVWAPGAQYNSLALCTLEDTQPQLFAVSKPFGSAGEVITIQGKGFGLAGTLTLGGLPVAADSWSDTLLTFTVPAMTAGPQQLLVQSENGMQTANGMTFHLLGLEYNPTVYEVGPGKTYDPTNALIYDGTSRGPIQHALDDAWAAGGESLVVVYPGVPAPMVNTLGMYLENLIIYSPVKLQGVGPGGILPDSSRVPGTIIDGRAIGGDSPYNLWWNEVFIPDLWLNRGGWDMVELDVDGNPIVYEGAVITVLAEEGEFAAASPSTIDGFAIQGGDQQGFPNNRNFIGGELNGLAAIVVVQGGGIYINGYAPNMEVTNNLIQSNGGSYGGGIRIGTPHLRNGVEGETNSYNENITIAHNRLLANGGTNLAGAIGLFGGAGGYEIAFNDICGNSTIEYGGGISHYGLSPNSSIHDNRIYFNSAYDEGGGIMIAGELPADPSTASDGAGAVDVFNNLIQSNMSNDDGGGLRFLMAGLDTYNVFNNVIVNNVSTHEGGGISLNDAPYANIFNNTIMNNLTTATAVTSDGTAAPAGLASSRNSVLLQGSLPVDAPLFSDPVLYNNLFWDNRAGSYSWGTITGLGLPGDPTAIFNWDLGLADGSGMLSPTYSLLQVPYGANPTNIVGMDPMVVSAYTTQIQIFPWRGNANFIGASIVAVNLPISLQSDYRIQFGSPAMDFGTVIGAPAFDFEAEVRPQGCGFDIGADETPLPTSALLYFAKDGSKAIPGVTLPFDDANVYAWDGVNYWCQWSGTQAGLPLEARVQGVSIEADGSMLLNLAPVLTLPGIVDPVTSEDIVRYQDGAWSLVFDGSDVGLAETNGIDAFEFLADGSLVLSTEGSATLGGIRAGGEDLLRCAGTFGETSTCTWSMYFDGSDVSLRVDVDGLHVADNGDIYLSTWEAFSIGGKTGLSGDRQDVFACHAPVTGTSTACTSYSLFFDGSLNGIIDENMTAFDLPFSLGSLASRVQFNHTVYLTSIFR